MTDADTAALLLRVVIGIVLVAHGYNHGWGAGGLSGTAGWFESIGLRPPRVHAFVSAWLEVLAGLAIIVGLLLPLAAAAVVGIMVTAIVTTHRKNGFFVFKDGYEYVLVLAVSLVSLSILGAGKVSLDHALGIEKHGEWVGLGVIVLGLAGAAALLITSWRPGRNAD